MNWELGPFGEVQDRTRDVRVFRAAFLIDGKFGGTVNLTVDGETLVFRNLHDLDARELGQRMVDLLGPHVGQLVDTGWLPRADPQEVLEIRIVGEEARGRLAGEPQSKPSSSSRVSPVLHALTVKGVFGFASSQTLELSNQCTVGFGENGSGKTSIRKVLAALRNAARGETFFRVQEAWLHQAELLSGTATLSVKAGIVQGQTISYSLVLTPARSGLAVVSAETLEVEGDDIEHDLRLIVQRPASQFDALFLQSSNSPDGVPVAAVAYSAQIDRATISGLRDVAAYPIAGPLREVLDRIRLYSSWDFATAAQITGRNSDEPNSALDDDGGNLGAFLSHLTSKGGKERFDDWFVRVMGGGPILRVDGGSIKYEHEGRRLSAAELSDGSLRWAQVVAACLSDASLRVFDEPELGLHPDLIDSLAELLAQTSLTAQTLVFTHSPDLLDSLHTYLPDHGQLSLVAFEQEPDCNTITIPDLQALRAEVDLAHFSVGELWKKGLLGGNRW